MIQEQLDVLDKALDEARKKAGLKPDIKVCALTPDGKASRPLTDEEKASLGLRLKDLVAKTGNVLELEKRAGVPTEETADEPVVELKKAADQEEKVPEGRPVYEDKKVHEDRAWDASTDGPDKYSADPDRVVHEYKFEIAIETLKSASTEDLIGELRRREDEGPQDPTREEFVKTVLEGTRMKDTVFSWKRIDKWTYETGRIDGTFGVRSKLRFELKRVRHFNFCFTLMVVNDHDQIEAYIPSDADNTSSTERIEIDLAALFKEIGRCIEVRAVQSLTDALHRKETRVRGR